jgi:multidrug efflux system outer membrane protein
MNAAPTSIRAWLGRPLGLMLVLLLSACASLSPDAGLSDVQQLAQGRTAGVTALLAPDPDAAQARVTELLSRPLDSDAAVRIALLNNPGLHAALATLQISDAQRVQAGRLPNPHLALGRFREGETVEIERLLRFDVIGLLALPWRAQWQGRQHELAKLQAAQQVIRLAADTRKAWIQAVAAQQTAAYMDDVKEAAEAGAELARRMARVGNWSRLRQAREQLMLADTLAQLARARHQALVEREKLTRLMGLWGEQASYRLEARLPNLPDQASEWTDIEGRALRERLDVRSAITESGHVADSLGMVKTTGYLNGLELGYERSTSFDNAAGSKETRRGWEIELALPLFDFGGARNARAEALYRQSLAQVREVAVRARSEARESWHGYRSAYDLARHYRDEIAPLRKFISEETLLRYNGMLASVWDLLADHRAQVQGVIGAIEAQRDFWLAETDLRTSLNGTSPGALAGMRSGTGGATEAAAAH